MSKAKRCDLCKQYYDADTKTEFVVDGVRVSFDFKDNGARKNSYRSALQGMMGTYILFSTDDDDDDDAEKIEDFCPHCLKEILEHLLGRITKERYWDKMLLGIQKK